jgi:serine/threonine-protein kinase
MSETELLTTRLIRAGVLRPRRADAAAVLEVVTDENGYVAELVRRGWLTPLQSRWVLRGYAHRLAVGPYVLLDRLGRGGMGHVFLARHRSLKRQVALKVARGDRQKRTRSRVLFEREARALARLRHPNVIRGYDAGQDHGADYLTMEYVPGPDLGQLVLRNGPLSPGMACEYIRQAALGLQHVHDVGLVHRDVKPANLGLAEGVIKVLDVGLAKAVGRDCTLTRPGRLVGSADFAAPEQVTDSRAVDPRADVYALGATLYFLLTGEVPFPDGTKSEKALRRLKYDPRPVEDLDSEVPNELGEVVRRLMTRNPSERIPTAAAAAKMLTPFAAPSGRGDPALNRSTFTNGPTDEEKPAD